MLSHGPSRFVGLLQGCKCYSEVIFAAAARTGDYVMWQMLLQFTLQWIVPQMERFHMRWAAISFGICKIFRFHLGLSGASARWQASCCKFELEFLEVSQHPRLLYPRLCIGVR